MYDAVIQMIIKGQPVRTVWVVRERGDAARLARKVNGVLIAVLRRK